MAGGSGGLLSLLLLAIMNSVIIGVSMLSFLVLHLIIPLIP